MDTPAPSPQSIVERLVSWVALLAAIVLGWVLLWALGWSIDLKVDDDASPVHALWRECPGLESQQQLVIIGVGLLVLVGVTLIARAVRRKGWWQVGLWAGFLVMVDLFLMLQYLRYVLPWVDCVRLD
jgi:hypothetical protein